jgi:hypothetical protein
MNRLTNSRQNRFQGKPIQLERKFILPVTRKDGHLGLLQSKLPKDAQLDEFIKDTQNFKRGRVIKKEITKIK